MSEPIDILGIDVDQVGRARNDGSRGSGLYAVPIRLSRPVTAREAQLLVHHWDHPSSYTTMHRPGIAEVAGDRFVLTATTVEEVERCHARTVRLAVEATNAAEAELRDLDARTARVDAAAAGVHQQQVRDTAARIRF